MVSKIRCPRSEEDESNHRRAASRSGDMDESPLNSPNSPHVVFMDEVQVLASGSGGSHRRHTTSSHASTRKAKNHNSSRTSDRSDRSSRSNRSNRSTRSNRSNRSDRSTKSKGSRSRRSESDGGKSHRRKSTKRHRSESPANGKNDGDNAKIIGDVTPSQLDTKARKDLVEKIYGKDAKNIPSVDVSALIKLLLPYLHAIQNDVDENELLTEKSEWIKNVENKEEIKTKFRFMDSIGDGSFAVVHKAVHRKSKNLVAIKEVDKTKLQPENKKFIENEVEILTTLRHKNIIRLIGAYQSENYYWIVTEISEYGDIYKAVMADGVFSENMTTGVIRDVAHALKYLHGRNIVHRDIKLDNMLFVSGERVKLADFGVACKVKGPLKRMCGTLLYVAPEIISKTGYGIQSDIYSLGVSAYAMMSGHFPFYDDQQDKLINMVVNEDPNFDFEPWDPITESGIKFVQKLMEKKPDERMTADEVLKSKWIKHYKAEPFTTRLTTFALL